MVIMSIDPGGTTGWCVVQLPGFVATAGQCRSAVELIDVLDQHKPQVVVSEAFRLYPWRARNLSWNSMPAAEIIGAVKTWCDKNSIEYCEQPASSRQMVSKEWLQSSGLWTLTKGKPHARDAARHLLYYCVSKGHVNPSNLGRRSDNAS